MTFHKTNFRKITFLQLCLLFISVSLLAALVACSSSSSSTTPPPTNTTPSVSLSTVPTPTPTSLTVNATLSLTATVTNDSQGGGVTWSASCGNTTSGGCGTFSASQSASGVAVTYTAPATVPSAAVVITATVVDDTSVIASTASITINPAAAPITVSLSTVPTSLFVNDTTSVTAIVANDSGNGGVTWSCTPVGTCGTFSSSGKTASGVAVTYTAPAAVPTSTIVITATAVDDTSASKSAPAITINPASGIMVALGALSTPINPGTAIPVTATVTGDSTNPPQVNWSCSPAANCGSFSLTQTDSGAASTFTAGNVSGNVIITATSVTDNAQSASGTITVTTAAGATSLAPGNYVFFLAGEDGLGSAYNLAGVFNVSTAGGVTTITGKQDFADFNYEVHDAISSGTIAPSSNIVGDSNLTITLETGDPCIGAGSDGTCNPGTGSGEEVLNVSLISSSKGLLSEYDNWASSSGTLDLQAAALTPPSGGYAFYLGIPDTPFAFGGVVNIDNAGGVGGDISGTGSIFDINAVGNTYPNQLFVAPSAVSGPDSSGFVTFNLYSSGILQNTNNLPGITLIGYMVDSSHIRLVENLNLDYTGLPLGGTALGQTGAGTFSASSISGSTYVFGSAGTDANGLLQVAGALTFNADGSLTGNISFNDLFAQNAQGGSALAAEVAATPCSSGSAVTPCYTIDSSGIGQVIITNLTDNATSPTFNFNLNLYLTGDGHATLISMDLGDTLSGLGAQQASSFSAASFNGSYALGVTQNSGVEQDGVGLVQVNGVASPPTLTGFVDLNESLVPVPDLSLIDSFSANADGIFTGTLIGLYTQSTTTPLQFTYYFVDPTNAVAIENDTNQLSLGLFELQQ